jgi:hypothetical protein
MTEMTIEHEECEAVPAWVREGAIAVVARCIADLQSCADANAPERLEFFQRLLTRLEEGGNGDVV